MVHSKPHRLKVYGRYLHGDSGTEQKMYTHLSQSIEKRTTNAWANKYNENPLQMWLVVTVLARSVVRTFDHRSASAVGVQIFFIKLSYKATFSSPHSESLDASSVSRVGLLQSQCEYQNHYLILVIPLLVMIPSIQFCFRKVKSLCGKQLTINLF